MVHGMNAQPHEAQEPVPERPARSTPRRFTIQSSRSGWSLEDSRGEVGGRFTTLGAALDFTRSEQRRAGGSIRVVVTSEHRREGTTHAS